MAAPPGGARRAASVDDVAELWAQLVDQSWTWPPRSDEKLAEAAELDGRMLSVVDSLTEELCPLGDVESGGGEGQDWESATCVWQKAVGSENYVWEVLRTAPTLPDAIAQLHALAFELPGLAEGWAIWTSLGILASWVLVCMVTWRGRLFRCRRLGPRRWASRNTARQLAFLFLGGAMVCLVLLVCKAFRGYSAFQSGVTKFICASARVLNTTIYGEGEGGTNFIGILPLLGLLSQLRSYVKPGSAFLHDVHAILNSTQAIAPTAWLTSETFSLLADMLVEPANSNPGQGKWLHLCYPCIGLGRFMQMTIIELHRTVGFLLAAARKVVMEQLNSTAVQLLDQVLEHAIWELRGLATSTELLFLSFVSMFPWLQKYVSGRSPVLGALVLASVMATALLGAVAFLAAGAAAAAGLQRWACRGKWRRRRGEEDDVEDEDADDDEECEECGNVEEDDEEEEDFGCDDMVRDDRCSGSLSSSGESSCDEDSDYNATVCHERSKVWRSLLGGSWEEDSSYEDTVLDERCTLCWSSCADSGLFEVSDDGEKAAVEDTVRQRVLLSRGGSNGYIRERGHVAGPGPSKRPRPSRLDGAARFCAHLAWCLGFLGAAVPLCLGGLWNVALRPIAGLCFVLANVTNDTVEDLGHLFFIAPGTDAMVMAKTFVDRCIMAPNASAAANLLDIIFVREPDNTTLTVRQKLERDVKGAVELQFQLLQDLLDTYLNETLLLLSTNPAVLGLRQVLRDDSIDAMLLPDFYKMPQDPTYRPLLYGRGTQLAFWTTCNCEDRFLFFPNLTVPFLPTAPEIFISLQTPLAARQRRSLQGLAFPENLGIPALPTPPPWLDDGLPWFPPLPPIEQWPTLPPGLPTPDPAYLPELPPWLQGLLDLASKPLELPDFIEATRNVTLPGIRTFGKALSQYGRLLEDETCAQSVEKDDAHPDYPWDVDVRAAGNAYMSLKRSILMSRAYRCDLFKDPANPSDACDPKDMMRDAQGRWQGDCLRYDQATGSATMARKERLCSLPELNEYMAQFDIRIAKALQRLDADAKALADAISKDLRQLIDTYLSQPIDELVTGAGCGYLATGYKDVLEGLCLQGATGLWRVALGLQACGALMAAITAVSYGVWRCVIEDRRRVWPE